MAVTVRIDVGTVVVECMHAHDAARFQRALVSELQRLAGAQEDWAGVGSRPNDAPLSVRYDGRPEDAAARVSQAIVGGESR